jgi:uncharacterized protein DUF4175
MKRVVVIGALWVGVLLAPGASHAQEESSGGFPELVGQERRIQRQFIELKTRMLQLAELLDQAEPDTARALREAVSQAQRAFIAEEMDEVADLLSRGLLGAAQRSKGEVVEELQEMLRTLRYGLVDLDQRLDRLREWRKLLDKVDELVQGQQALERASRLSRDADSLDQQVEDAARRLSGIIAEQQELLSATRSLPAPDDAARRTAELRKRVRELIERQQELRSAARETPIQQLGLLGEEQERLASDAEALGADMAKESAPGGADVAQEHLARAASEMRSAAIALAQSNASGAEDPQEQAEIDLRRAEDALTEALRERGESTPSGAMARKQEELALQARDLSEQVARMASEADMDASSSDLSTAAERMDVAADELTAQESAGAAKAQEEALAELRKRSEEVARLRRRIAEEASKPLDEQADEQEGLADRAGEVAKQMASDANQPAPGHAGMQNASKSMQEAKGQLSGGSPGEANDSQKRALEELQRTRAELAEAIDRQQKQAQAESLAKIDERLDRMLAAQRTATQRTADVAGKVGPEGFDRAGQLALVELSNEEGSIAEQADEVLVMLKREGTTVVFPAVLTELAEDLRDVQDRLSRRDPGDLTQGIQAEIERSLEEMIDAIRKELSNRRKQGSSPSGGGGGGGAGGKRPLIPPVAELKMLRAMQLQVNRRTKLLAEEKSRGTTSPEQLAREHKSLAGREDKVRSLTLEVARRMKR